MFEWLIKINYMKLSRKSYLLNNNEDDYDKMIEAILEGFYKFIVIDRHNDKDEINIYKVEYFLVGLIELKYLMNDLSIFKNYHITIMTFEPFSYISNFLILIFHLKNKKY